MAQPDTKSAREPPHQIRSIKTHWIENGGRRAIGGDPRHLDKRRRVCANQRQRRQGYGRRQCRPLGDAEDARVGRGTRGAKQVEQALLFRSIATLPA